MEKERPKDIVLILFGGSGSEIEVCKLLNRQYISSEIDKVYYKMIIDRLRKGKIDVKYRLKMKKEATRIKELERPFLEERKI